VAQKEKGGMEKEGGHQKATACFGIDERNSFQAIAHVSKGKGPQGASVKK